MPTSESAMNLPVLLFDHPDAWEAWLAEHAESAPGVWLQLAKKAASLQSISYQDAVEVALCYGWIDGQAKGYDEISWLQRFTPRRPQSVWSQINRAKALALIEQGRMQPAGLAAIERARANGRWDAAYDSPRTAAPPEDFQKALDETPAAKTFFETLNSQNRYAILYRIQTAKKAETRQKRITQFIQMLENQETIYP